MAGWTSNRQARRPLQRRRSDLDLAPQGSAGGGVDALTINTLLAPREPLAPARPPAQRSPSSLDDAAEDQLTRLVEAEIIPRLMLLHRVETPGAARPAPAFLPTDAHVLRLSELAVYGDADAAPAYVHSLVAQGATPEQVFLDLLAASARYMGQRWEEDRYSFSEVTIGLWRLQRVLHDHAQRAPAGRAWTGPPLPAGGRAGFAAHLRAEHRGRVLQPGRLVRRLRTGRPLARAAAPGRS